MAARDGVRLRAAFPALPREDARRTQPLRTIVPFNAQSWFNVNLVVNGASYTRRLYFVKR
jgi:hypothetical protein